MTLSKMISVSQTQPLTVSHTKVVTVYRMSHTVLSHNCFTDTGKLICLQDTDSRDRLPGTDSHIRHLDTEQS